jgi:Tfp pilus assembly protein PilE
MLDKRFMNNKGFTIIEGLIGAGLLGIVAIIAAQGFDFVRKGSTQASTLNTTENRVNEIVQTIKSNISQQIISYPASSAAATISTANPINTGGAAQEQVEVVLTGSNAVDYYINSILNPASLPMAWSLNSDSVAADCATCPGRYGYIITAVPGYSGLYKVTIKFTHNEWPEAKIYNFVVSK